MVIGSGGTSILFFRSKPYCFHDGVYTTATDTFTAS